MNFRPVNPSPVFVLILFLLAVLSASCDTGSSLIPTPEPTKNSVPTAAPTDYMYDTTARWLGFIHQNNVWLAAFPGGKVTQLTDSNDVQVFAWSSDGSTLATFNGQDLCFKKIGNEGGGSTSIFCISAAITGIQPMQATRLLWSPDDEQIVIVGDTNWVIMTLQDPAVSLNIQDPLQWGVNMVSQTPGTAQIGMPIFQADSTLLGTFTHTAFCGSGTCTYRIYRLNPGDSTFIPEPIKGLGDERWGRLALSTDGKVMLNYSISRSDCENFSTFVDIVYPETSLVSSLQFSQQAFYEIVFSPDGARVMMSQGGVCQAEIPNRWAADCGLAPDYEVYPMQLWKLQSTSPRTDSVPGLNPVWSADGRAIAFRSCLTEPTPGGWQPVSEGPPWIFIMDAEAIIESILPVYEGSSPIWKP